MALITASIVGNWMGRHDQSHRTRDPRARIAILEVVVTMLVLVLVIAVLVLFLFVYHDVPLRAA